MESSVTTAEAPEHTIFPPRESVVDDAPTPWIEHDEPNVVLGYN